MNSKTVFVDVIHNPYCFIEAPEESYKKELEEKWDIIIREFNIWEIEDSELDLLPEHISRTIKEVRDPNNPDERWPGGGSLFFLNGRKLDLSPALKWPQVEAVLSKMRKEKIKDANRRTNQSKRRFSKRRLSNGPLFPKVLESVYGT